MSDERFDRIERWQRQADERFDQIDHWQANADGRFDRLEEWQRKADERFDRIDQHFDGIGERFDRTDQRIGVLHEDVLARIAAVGEGFPRLEAKLDRRFSELVELLKRRIDPLEAAVRHHSAEIDELRKRGG